MIFTPYKKKEFNGFVQLEGRVEGYVSHRHKLFVATDPECVVLGVSSGRWQPQSPFLAPSPKLECRKGNRPLDIVDCALYSF